MNTLKQIVVNIVKDESGQDLIEYALIAGILGLGAVASMKTLAGSISTALGSIGTSITTNV